MRDRRGVGLVCALVSGCELPDQAQDGEAWCSAGTSVLEIEDEDVPQAIKGALYASGGVLGADDAAYAATIPVVVIPYTLPGAPRNASLTPDRIRADLFETENASIADYYLENSWGQLRLREGAISGWVDLALTMEEYGEGQLGSDWTRNPQVAQDAAQGSTVAWETLDTNDDRRIDYPEAQVVLMGPLGGGGATRPAEVQIVYGGETWTIRNSFVFFDAKRGDDADAGTDTLRYNFPAALHELNHGLFNLPDRYTGGSGDGPTGWYDPMTEAYRMKHLSLYDKVKIGWIQPRILAAVPDRATEDRRCYSFAASEGEKEALALVDVDNPDQYWLIENRWIGASGYEFESGLPESGLAIWWGKDDGSVRLIDASIPDQNPTLYADQVRDALFRQQTGSDLDPAVVPRLLLRDDDLLSYALRGVSPAGETMYVEL